MNIHIHPTAEVSEQAIIGQRTFIWHHSQIREGSHIGANCIIGKGVYIDTGVIIGNNVKIQNYVSIFHGVTIEDGVFIGPHVCFTNDLRPRAINSDGTLKSSNDWELRKTIIQHGASLGANSTIRCGINIGKWAMVGAGSVVTHDVPDFGLVFGNPAYLHGFVCPCGANLIQGKISGRNVRAECPECMTMVNIPLENWEKIE